MNTDQPLPLNLLKSIGLHGLIIHSSEKNIKNYLPDCLCPEPDEDFYHFKIKSLITRNYIFPLI